MGSTVNQTYAGNKFIMNGFSNAPVIRKKRKKKKRKDESFEDVVAEAVLSADEVVRRRGSAWVLYDDDTGAEAGSYSKRAAAWAAQRARRAQRKIRQSQQQKIKHSRHKADVKTRQHAKSVLSLARKPKKADIPHTIKASKHKKKHENFVLQIAQNLLNEVAPYVFEQSPSSHDSVNWDNLVARISHETLQSDPKLKQILANVHQARLRTLDKAVKALKTNLQQTKQFELSDHKVERDTDGEPALAFSVKMVRSNKKLPFSIVIQNNKPVLSIPDPTRDTLNSMGTDDSKLLRAELMHTQETVFDNMHDVVKMTDKRDNYLKNMESHLDKMVSSMIPVEIAMLKNLLKQKYKGMR